MQSSPDFKLNPLSFSLKLHSGILLVLMASAAQAASGTINGQVLTNSLDTSVLNTLGEVLTITNSTVAHVTGGIGITASLGTAPPAPSVVNVFDSKVTGGAAAALVASGSEIHFTRSTVESLLPTGMGILNSGAIGLYDAQAYATDSSITGAASGVFIESLDFVPGKSLLRLDNSQVQGKTGSAISVRGNPASVGTHADIQVLNGSTLIAGNGELLTVTDNSSANMSVDDSRLFGNIVADSGSTIHLQLNNNAWLTGQLVNVEKADIGAQSHWVLVGDSQVGALNLAGGTVNFGAADEFYRLNVETLSGNGTFAMDTDFGGRNTDFLNVTGEADGNHQLQLAATGTEPTTAERIQVVHTGGGTAEFALVGDTVDAGAYSYGLKKDGTDWYLDTDSTKKSATTQAVMALFNTAPTVWYGEMTTLRSRMGELRFSGGKSSGLWARSYGSKYEVSSDKRAGVDYNQTQRGFTLGADTPLSGGDGQWLAGVMAGHSTSDLAVTRGTGGTVKSYYVGAYATWLDEESGYYLDAVAKLNRFHNEANVTMSDGKKAKGNYAQNGVGASLEFGRHIKLDDDYFVEPYSQISAVITQRQSYELDNKVKAEGDRSSSVVAKAGMTAGKEILLDSGSILQPYLRAAVAHEFDQANKVSVNDKTFNNDLSGSRLELGAGMAVSMSKNLALNAEFQTSRGKNIKEPYNVTLGVRYSF